MKRSLFGAVALAVVALIVVSGAAASQSGVTSNGFETDTAGWFNFGGTITQVSSPYANPAYANGIPSASGSGLARLDRGPCETDTSFGSAPSLLCTGPYTDWGNSEGFTWNGPSTTQVDIYLDTAYAVNHPDVYPDLNTGNTRDGNLAGLSVDEGGDPTNPENFGTRFDFTSAMNHSGSGFLKDFGFNVSTGTATDTVDGVACEGFVVNATTNVNRQGANPNAAGTKKCIATSGWYTFKHSFSENATHYLKVVMEITPVGSNTPAASWTIENQDLISTVGCNRYGWFSNQEIYGLPIDNAKITGGCSGPSITDGQILPTGTTCQVYDAGTNPLGTVQYTLTKGGNINSVAPGVFFYYGTISGTANQTFTITQTDNSATAPFIPVQHGQVLLYDANCNLLKWKPDTDANGVVTGTLPSTGGTFIISVKYSLADLKNLSNPGMVTYTIDGTSITLAPKPKA
jgi:hypothetical protein